MWSSCIKGSGAVSPKDRLLTPLYTRLTALHRHSAGQYSGRALSPKEPRTLRNRSTLVHSFPNPANNLSRRVNDHYAVLLNGAASGSTAREFESQNVETMDVNYPVDQ